MFGSWNRNILPQGTIFLKCNFFYIFIWDLRYIKRYRHPFSHLRADFYHFRFKLLLLKCMIALTFFLIFLIQIMLWNDVINSMENQRHSWYYRCHHSSYYNYKTGMIYMIKSVMTKTKQKMNKNMVGNLCQTPEKWTIFCSYLVVGLSKIFFIEFAH